MIHAKSIVPALATSLLLIAATAQARSTWYVDDDGPLLGGCTTWADACPDLQTALSAAQPGDEIRVARGFYTPTGPDGDRAATFQLIGGVAHKGGYLGLSAGEGEDPNDRDVRLYQTTLSGDLNRDDGLSFENNDENSYHVVSVSGADADTILDGFTVTAGNADGAWPHDFGGGLYNTASPTVRNCSFVENWAVHGGGVYNTFGHPTMIDCYFVGNATTAWGGGIDNFSAMPTLVNCVLANNTTAGEGGAMHSDLSTPTMTNCTISGNTGDRGGGLFTYAGTVVTLTNCVAWANTDSLGSIEASQLYRNASENDFIVNHSCVQGWTGEYGGVGNMADDPLFVSPDQGNRRLQSDSPCIDAGSNDALPEDVTTDLDGRPRFVDGDENGSVIVDLGAYEFQGAGFCPADLDGSGEVRVPDLIILLGAWGLNPGHAADFDGDGQVRVPDLIILLGAWGACQ